MTHIINIEGIQLYGFHGCLPEEAKIGGNYTVDVFMTTNFTKAIENDDLLETIDYCAIYEICKIEMAIRNKLIETVCSRIFNTIQSQFTTLKTLHVKLTKHCPPMNGNVNNVSVEMSS
jgi:7,8-dihydroneopterin aldolase/epimerase/oxygenase